MNKRIIIILIILGLLLVPGIYIFLRRRRSESPAAPLPAQDLEKTEKANDWELTPEKYLKIATKDYRLASKIYRRFYGNLQGLQNAFSSPENKRRFIEWLQTEKTDAIRNQTFTRNLSFWLAGETESPEASIFRHYVLDTKGITKGTLTQILKSLQDSGFEFHKINTEIYDEGEEKALSSSDEALNEIDYDG